MAIRFPIKITSGAMSDTEKKMATSANGIDTRFLEVNRIFPCFLKAAMGLSQYRQGSALGMEILAEVLEVLEFLGRWKSCWT